MTTIDQARFEAIQERIRSIDADGEAVEHIANRVNTRLRQMEAALAAADKRLRELEQLAYSQGVLLAEQGAKIAELQARLAQQQAA